MPVARQLPEAVFLLNSGFLYALTRLGKWVQSGKGGCESLCEDSLLGVAPSSHCPLS